MSMTVAELITIYSAEDSVFQRVTGSVEDRFKKTAREAEKTEKAIGQTYDRAGRGLENLLSRLPGGSRLSQFKSLAEDIGDVSTAAKAGEGTLVGMTGAVGAAGGAALLAGAGLVVLTAAAIGAGVGAYQLAARAAEAGGEVYDLSRRTGVGVELLSGLRLAFKQSGVEAGEFAQGVNFLTRQIGAAAVGSEQATARLRQFGIEPLEALANEELALGKVFRRINDLPPGWERVIAAQNAFGKSGGRLVDLIETVGGDFEEFMRKARAAGLVMSTEAAKAADEFGDKLLELETRIDAVVIAVGNGLLPEFIRAFDEINAALDFNTSSWAAWSNDIADYAMHVRAQIAQTAAEIRTFLSSEALIPFRVGERGAEAYTASLRESRKRRGLLYDLNSPTPDYQKEAGQAEISRALSEMYKAQGRVGGDYGDTGGRRRGGGGGRSRQPKDLTSLFSQLAGDESSLRMASFGFDVTKFKAELDTEQQALEASLREQLTSVADYWKKRETLTLAGLDNEVDHLRRQRAEAARLFSDKQVEIGADGKTSAPEKSLKLQIEATKWQTKDVQLQGQIAEATERRRAAQADIASQTRLATRELERSMNALKADFLEATNDPVEAARLRIADKLAGLRALASANKSLFPDADKWLEVLNKMALRDAQLSAQRSRFDLAEGDLNLESARIQDQITDGVLSEREGRRQVYELELKHRETLRGILNEMLGIARLRDDKKAIQSIEEQIRQTERLGHVINETKARARDTFEDLFTQGLQDLEEGLTQAAANFGLNILRALRDETARGAAQELGKVLFGKSDEYGSDGGLLGGLAKRIGLGNVFDGKGKNPQAAALTVNTSATERNTFAVERLTAAMSGASLSGGRLSDEEDFGKFFEENSVISNDVAASLHEANHTLGAIEASVNNQGFLTTNAIHELGNLMVALQPQGPGLLGQILVAAVGAIGQGIAGSLFRTDDTSDEGPPQPRPTTPPVLKRAKGGPVSAGTLYEVNEEGREFFRPDFDGEVIPLSKMNGKGEGTTIINRNKYVTVNMTPSRAASTYRSKRGARETAEDLLSFLR